MDRLVHSRSTCPPPSPPPLANTFVIGIAVINTHPCQTPKQGLAGSWQTIDLPCNRGHGTLWRGTVCGRCLLAWTLPRVADDGDGCRIPFASISHHTLILLAHASSPYSPPRPRKGNFAHANRSDGLRNLLELQALHPAQPSALALPSKVKQGKNKS